MYTYQEEKVGSKSMYVKYGMQNEGQEPKIKNVHWSLNPPVNANEQSKPTNEFNVGRGKNV